jgi:ABC-type uncharacterized transport system involved in gliding motility auxiliary subunit
MASLEQTIFKRKTYGGAALVALAVLFIGLIMLSSYLLRGMRLDLTQNNQYTLAPGTENILKGIEEPINLYFYFSRKAGDAAPYLKIYATRVRELLEEMSARARGNIRLQVIDPEPFSEEEDRASELGLSPVPLGSSGETMYFGLAGTNSTDGKAAIEVFHPDKEEFLEYDIARMILELNTPQKPTLGLMSGLPMSADFDPRTGQQRESWAVLSQLQPLFDVETLDASVDTISADVDVLMVVHPKDLPERALFAIEQFIMRGGHALLFVDPRAEADPAGQGNPQDPYSGMMAPRHSTLGKLFTAWGVEFDTGQITSDTEHALVVSSPMGTPVRHLGYIGLNEDALNRQDVITGSIETVNFATPGSFSLTGKSGLKMEPLIQTSAEAGLIPAAKFTMLMGDPSVLREDYKAGGERKVIAARLTGAISTAFPEGEPDAPAAAEGALATPPRDKQPALQASEKPVNIILVADTDVLTDMMWVRRQSFFGQAMSQAFASNGDFVMNAVDNLAGSSDLISIRGRASFVRPFTKVEDIKRQAEDRFQAKEKELEEELSNTEQKLGELQSARGDADSAFMMSPEQEAELQRFQDEKIRIRKELREVRHGLDQDIKKLGRNLQILNIGLMPLLLTGFALGVVAWRRRARKQGGRS